MALRAIVAIRMHSWAQTRDLTNDQITQRWNIARVDKREKA